MIIGDKQTVPSWGNLASETGRVDFAHPEHIEQFFTYAHLPPHLQEVSKPFGDLAEWIVATLPPNPERIVALRKLLECKDAAVRARLAHGSLVGAASPEMLRHVKYVARQTPENHVKNM